MGPLFLSFYATRGFHLEYVCAPLLCRAAAFGVVRILLKLIEKYWCHSFREKMRHFCWAEESHTIIWCAPSSNKHPLLYRTNVLHAPKFKPIFQHQRTRLLMLFHSKMNISSRSNMIILEHMLNPNSTRFFRNEKEWLLDIFFPEEYKNVECDTFLGKREETRHIFPLFFIDDDWKNNRAIRWWWCDIYQDLISRPQLSFKK